MGVGQDEVVFMPSSEKKADMIHRLVPDLDVAVRNWRGNQMLVRLLPTSKWVPLDRYLWIVVAVLIASAVIVSAEVLIRTGRSAGLGIVALGLMLLFGSPFITFGYAVLMSVQDTRTDDYALMKLTPITARAIVQGYFIGVLYRLRLFYLILVSLMPAFVWEAVHIEPMQGGIDTVWQRVFLATIATLPLLAANISMASVGIWAGLRWRSPLAVLWGVPVVPVIAIFVVLSIDSLRGSWTPGMFVLAACISFVWRGVMTVMSFAMADLALERSEKWI
jgi:hypothetical protein